MPFGLFNAPATSDQLMKSILTGLNWKICLNHLDDVIVYGGNFYEALDRLKLVLQHIREAQLKLKASKCCLMHDRVPFGTRVKGSKSIPSILLLCRIGPHLAVWKMLGPSWARHLTTGITSLCSALCRFDQERCQTHMKYCEQAFLSVKKSSVQMPVLAYPTGQGSFVLCRDACDTGMGAVLEQEQEENDRVLQLLLSTHPRRWTQTRGATTL